MNNNIRQATTHKPVEMFFKFIFALFSGNTARSRCTFLAIANNLKLTNINGGRYKTRRINKKTAREITRLFLEIVNMTVVVMSNIPKKVRSLRLHGY